MRQLIFTVVATVIATAGVRAETVVSPAEFREYAEGYTLYFERDGQRFGSEAFEEGGKARWRYPDGSCVRGAWRPNGAQLCFLYETPVGTPRADVLCWRLLRDEDGMFARLLNGDEPGLELRVTGRDRRPLLCGEPGQST